MKHKYLIVLICVFLITDAQSSDFSPSLISVAELMGKDIIYQRAYIEGVLDSELVQVDVNGEFLNEMKCLKTWINTGAIADINSYIHENKSDWIAAAAIMISARKACPHLYPNSRKEK